MLSSFLNSPFERFSVEKYFAPNSDINWAYYALPFSSLSAFRVFWSFPCDRVCQIFFQSSRRETILRWRLVKIWKEDSLLQKRKINWYLYRAFKLWRARVDMSIYAFWTKHCRFVRVSKVKYGTVGPFFELRGTVELFAGRLRIFPARTSLNTVR